MLLWALDYYEQTVDYLRHGDIKHGLVTMAAFLGLLPADQGQSPGHALRPLQAGEDEQDVRGGGCPLTSPMLRFTICKQIIGAQAK